jgi:hypothetical protein
MILAIGVALVLLGEAMIAGRPEPELAAELVGVARPDAARLPGDRGRGPERVPPERVTDRGVRRAVPRRDARPARPVARPGDRRRRRGRGARRVRRARSSRAAAATGRAATSSRSSSRPPARSAGSTALPAVPAVAGADRLVEEPEAARLGGVERPVSVLFADLASFTTFSETRTPSAVIEMLNATGPSSSR